MSLDVMMAELRREYLDTFPGKISLMNQLFKDQKIPELQDEFHKLKGTGKTYGIAEVSVLAAVVESICENRSAELDWVVPTATELLAKIKVSRDQEQEFVLDQDKGFVKLQDLVK